MGEEKQLDVERELYPDVKQELHLDVEEELYRDMEDGQYFVTLPGIIVYTVLCRNTVQGI